VIQPIYQSTKKQINQTSINQTSINQNRNIMKNSRIITSIGLIIMSAAIISLSGCAAKKAAWGSMEKGMIMKYSSNPDKDLKYENTFDFEQEMEVMEKQISITAVGNQIFLMEPLDASSDDLEFKVTVEDMQSTITTPRGEVKAKTEKVIGQSFNITINKLGNELEYSAAEALVYEFAAGEEKSLASDIQAFFPDLPTHPVKAGDSWESKDHILEKSGSGMLIMDITNYNTFEKLETVNGYECMKVNATFVGTIEGSAKQEGMDLNTNGTIGGTSTWYYAFKEGIFVKQQTNGLGETLTKITGPREMELPATRKFIMTSELVVM